MKLSILIPALLTVLIVSCAGVPHVEPIDNALLVGVSDSGQAAIDTARTARDHAEDAYSAAKASTQQAKGTASINKASLATAKAQFEEAKAVAKLADTTSPNERQKAHADSAYAEARVAVARAALEASNQALELAECVEDLSQKEYESSVAVVELEKAKALQNVDLVAAQKISVADHMNQVSYYRGKTDAARSRVRTAQEGLNAKLTTLSELKVAMDATPH